MTPIARRQLAALLAGAALPVALPVAGRAADRRETLVIGLDIIDTLSLDPARQANYTPAFTLAACYDRLVTLKPGQYQEAVPSLAVRWSREGDGRLWRFQLDPAATFATGNRVTAEDVRFSLDRVRSLRDGLSPLLDRVVTVAAPTPDTVEITMSGADEPLLGILAAPEFGVMERAVAEAHGAVDGALAVSDDNATEWLNQNSAGSGAYVLSGWTRRQTIRLRANPHAWRGTPGYREIIIRHMPDAMAQLRALQRGDIDVAFNLIPEQVVALDSSPGLRADGTTALDMVYLALNANAKIDKALAIREARQAIGYAIDYDGLIGDLLGGKAVRPASFVPIGVPGSTAAVTAEIGYRQDLYRAKELLAAAGLSRGFSFDLHFDDGAFAGMPYQTLARKLAADLGRIGITARLRPRNPVQLRSAFVAGQVPAVLAFWNSPVVETAVWARATVERLARRVDALPSDELLQLIGDATAPGLDRAEQAALWVEFQRSTLEAANLLVLFQPVYQVGLRQAVGQFPLTGAGWFAELGEAKPA